MCIPWGDNQRYDMIAEFDGKFNRIQIKTCNTEKNGSIICTCRSSQNHTTNKKYSNYVGDIDYFVFFNQVYDKIAIVPIEEVGDKTNIYLRIAPTKNGQIQNTKYFDDFSFDIFFKDRQSIPEEVRLSNELKKKKEEEKPKKKCPSCGKEISKKATYCIDCHNKSLQRAERPSREELKEMIRTMPFVQIGKKFGVSDNSIRKWCDAYELPRKKTDINNFSDEEWELI